MPAGNEGKKQRCNDNSCNIGKQHSQNKRSSSNQEAFKRKTIPAQSRYYKKNSHCSQEIKLSIYKIVWNKLYPVFKTESNSPHFLVSSVSFRYKSFYISCTYRAIMNIEAGLLFNLMCSNSCGTQLRQDQPFVIHYFFKRN